MGSSGSAPTNTLPKLPVQDGSIPEWMASIHKLVYSLPVIGEGLALDKMNRVKPGTLVKKDPDSVVALYLEFV